jgi:hypothetical protein
MERNDVMAEDAKVRQAWESRLEQLTKEYEGAFVTIEVLEPDYVANEEVEHLPFTAAAYDPRDDVVIVSVGGRTAEYPVVLRHMVWHPVEVDVADDAKPPRLRVVEKDGTTTVVVFYPTEA